MKTAKTIETEDGATRPASKTKTLKDTFKPATDKRVAEQKAKGSLSKTNFLPQDPGPNHVPVNSTDDKPVGKKKAAPKAEPTESQKITIKNKENPHAKGSKRAKHWDKLLTCKTTDDFKEKKGRMNLLPVWEKSGHITLG